MVYAFVKIHKIYMFTLNFTTIAESRVFCQKQGSKEKEPFDFVFNQKAFFLFLFLLLLLWQKLFRQILFSHQIIIRQQLMQLNIFVSRFLIAALGIKIVVRADDRAMGI